MGDACPHAAFQNGVYRCIHVEVHVIKTGCARLDHFDNAHHAPPVAVLAGQVALKRPNAL